MRKYCILMLIFQILPVLSGPWLWFSLSPRQAVEFVPPASFADPLPLYASEQPEPVNRRIQCCKNIGLSTRFFYCGIDDRWTIKTYINIIKLTCKLSWTRSASLLAKADSKMLECSRRALWDWANPANFPFSCSSSSASFLFASSNFRIRFLKHRDSWSCEINQGSLH